MHCVNEIVLINSQAQKLNETGKVQINGTKRRVQVTIVAVEKNTYSECVFVAFVIK
jgi:hypothetical protein